MPDSYHKSLRCLWLFFLPFRIKLENLYFSYSCKVVCLEDPFIMASEHMWLCGY